MEKLEITLNKNEIIELYNLLKKRPLTQKNFNFLYTKLENYVYEHFSFEEIEILDKTT